MNETEKIKFYDFSHSMDYCVHLLAFTDSFVIFFFQCSAHFRMVDFKSEQTRAPDSHISRNKFVFAQRDD